MTETMNDKELETYGINLELAFKRARDTRDTEAFLIESNVIEGIEEHPTPWQIEEFKRFMKLEQVSIYDLQRLVSTFQPDAKLRCEKGMDVRVGNYSPPRGGIQIIYRLKNLLRAANDRSSDFAKRLNLTTLYDLHIAYELLHPFTDGNGRSGRMLWAWVAGSVPSLGFLHTFYYQTLNNYGDKLDKKFLDND